MRHGHGGAGAHGTGAGHDLLAALLFGGRRGRVYAQLVVASGVRPGDRVLDVGCGDGYLTRRMARGAAPGGSALGIDPSPEAIGKARRRTRVPNCAFAAGRAEALDGADGAYDVVVSSLMIHHLPEADRARAIGEMFRVLRPGGRLLVAEFRPPTSRLGRFLIHVAPVVSPAMENNPVHLLEPMVRDAGFDDVGRGDLRPWILYVTGRRPPEVR